MVKESIVSVIKVNISTTLVVVLRATWRSSQSKPKKSEKTQPPKKSFYFRKWNFLALILKKIIFLEMRPCTLRPQLSKFFSKKNLIYSFQKNLSQKVSCVFLYFRKQNPALFSPRKFTPGKCIMLQETKTLQKTYVLGGNLQSLKIKNFFYKEI